MWSYEICMFHVYLLPFWSSGKALGTKLLSHLKWHYVHVCRQPNRIYRVLLDTLQVYWSLHLAFLAGAGIEFVVEFCYGHGSTLQYQIPAKLGIWEASKFCLCGR